MEGTGFEPSVLPSSVNPSDVPVSVSERLVWRVGIGHILGNQLSTFRLRIRIRLGSMRVARRVRSVKLARRCCCQRRTCKNRQRPPSRRCRGHRQLSGTSACCSAPGWVVGWDDEIWSHPLCRLSFLMPSGCISGSRSGCEWLRSCWPPAASLLATMRQWGANAILRFDPKTGSFQLSSPRSLRQRAAACSAHSFYTTPWDTIHTPASASLP